MRTIGHISFRRDPRLTILAGDLNANGAPGAAWPCHVRCARHGLQRPGARDLSGMRRAAVAPSTG